MINQSQINTNLKIKDVQCVHAPLCLTLCIEFSQLNEEWARYVFNLMVRK